MNRSSLPDRPVDALLNEVALLSPTSLEELQSVALLQTRFDRKYVVAPSAMQAVLEAHPDRFDALELNGNRSFCYRTLYFDTPELDSYRGAHARRRWRFKVRIREYLDHGTAVLEVKTKGGRGETVKARLAYDSEVRGDLTLEARTFVDAITRQPGLADRLVPVLTTSYRRSTFVDVYDGSRTTADVEVVCCDEKGNSAQFPGYVVVETKSRGAATLSDRWLWAHGQRPVGLSKFGVGMAVCNPELPSNRWHRVIERFAVRGSREISPVRVAGQPRAV